MKTYLLATLIGAAFTLTGVSNANADPITFAQFTSARGGNSYIFTNNGDETGTFNSSGQINITLFDGAIPTDKLFQPLPAGPQLANISRTSSTTGLTSCLGPCASGAAFVQGLTDSTINIFRVSDNALLLGITADFTRLSGQIGGAAGSLETSDPPNSLTFTSDFIDFSSAVSLSRSIAFTSATPFFSVAPDGLLRSFTAAGAGTFAVDFEAVVVAPTTPPVITDVPEPTSFALLGAGFIGLGLIRHRKAV